jgi:hypothetical protein
VSSNVNEMTVFALMTALDVSSSPGAAHALAASKNMTASHLTLYFGVQAHSRICCEDFGLRARDLIDISAVSVPSTCAVIAMGVRSEA